MSDRGFGLVDALVATALMAVVGMAATQLLVSLPTQAARWDEEADAHQRLRIVQARVAEIATRAGPIVERVGGVIVRVPSLWPHRLGYWDADEPGVVSSHAVTFLARTDGHRVLVAMGSVGAGGGDVSVAPGEGCGSAPACGLSEGDLVLVLSQANVCALFRIADVDDSLELAALMPGGPPFDAGAVMLPVTVTVLSFDAGAHEMRLYDGYRSDNALTDAVDAFELSFESRLRPAFDDSERGGPFLDDEGTWKGSGVLGDGPFAGAGPMAFDIDLLALGRLAGSVELSPLQEVPQYRRTFEWGIAAWPSPPPSS